VALERALVNIVNTVGVDINRAVSDAYYRCLLPFVSGLGPRKAASLVSRISNLVSTAEQGSGCCVDFWTIRAEHCQIARNSSPKTF